MSTTEAHDSEAATETNLMLYVGGSRYSFRCPCGCNIFTRTAATPVVSYLRELHDSR